MTKLLSFELCELSLKHKINSLITETMETFDVMLQTAKVIFTLPQCTFQTKRVEEKSKRTLRLIQDSSSNKMWLFRVHKEQVNKCCFNSLYSGLQNHSVSFLLKC